MFDSEEKRVLDKAHRGQDLEELLREEGVDAYPGRLTPEHIEEFQAVAASMSEILGEKPELRLSDKLTTTQQFALEVLYMAKTGKHLETGDFISGIERGEMFNQALMHLQPVVALGLRPDFTDGRPVYDQLVGQVTQTRAEITTAINVQIIPPKKEEPGKKAEQDDAGSPGDAPTGTDESGSGPAPEADSEPNHTAPSRDGAEPARTPE